MTRTVVRALTDLEAGVCQTLVQRRREADLRRVHGESIMALATEDLASIAIALKGLTAVMHGSHSPALGLDIATGELYEDVPDDTDATSIAAAIEAHRVAG